ncbi:MAG: class I SAM-dependent methyltransferase [Candidatus Hadarchaeales archaeon]
MIIVLIAIMMVILLFLASLLITFYWGAPWSPTPMRTVRKMLELAEVKKNEKVYDLGSGDGRIALTAAREFGALSVGVEINPILHLLARLRRSISGPDSGVTLLRKNFYDVNLADADVVAVYLSPWGNRKLMKKLIREIRAGTKVVSHKWRFDEWEPAKVDKKHQIYLYVFQRK